MASTAKVIPLHRAADDMLLPISEQAFADERETMDELLKAVAPYEPLWPEIHRHACAHIERIRSQGLGLSVEAFLQEYGLSSKEGVAVMCLAEALLRIPDRETANRLIESTFDGANWEKHVGQSDSLYVNASSWGLLLTGKLVQFGDETKQGVTATLGKLVHSASEPVIRKALKSAMKLIASQFVMGETMEDALHKAIGFEKKGYRFSYDMLGEGARSEQQAERYFASYRKAITAVGNTRRSSDSLYEAPGISIKLTALHPRYSFAKRERVIAELLPRLKALVLDAKDANICVAIDAEEATRLDIELEVFAALYRDPAFHGYAGIGFVLQAYQKRAYHVIDFLATLAQETGRRMPLRLVKGAYWDSEVKAAQLAGLSGYPVFTVKAHSDVSYLACANKILALPECFYPQFATHNALTVAAIATIGVGKEFEFQKLYGMGDTLYDAVIATHPCRVYAPIGEHRDLLAYLIRRLLENGANSSFIHLLMSKHLPVEMVLENPIAATRNHQGTSPLTLPAQLYGSDRTNSSGYDFGNRHQMAQLLPALAPYLTAPAPMAEASPAEIEAAISTSHAAFTSFSRTTPENRAAMLERAADLLQERAHQAIGLCVAEGGKTIPDAVAELREAIDFCRYYAARCRELFAPRTLTGPTGEHNRYELCGRGVFSCISPWNFPLAIFMGQVTAALAAGNCVIAKPAEQTPAIAAFSVALLHEAGIPADALHLLNGLGETVGATLVADERIAGVAFTGSTAVAKQIQRALAAREGAIVPLIAETGGQNAMLVDSSALLEQAVDDIVLSAFGSAGQRCSALRVLYVHEDVADDLIALIKGAMAELTVGDPSQLATDVGSVIDSSAKATLMAHIERMKQSATLIAATPLPTTPHIDKAFVAPHAFEIASIRELETEVFGPVLHIIRYAPATLTETLAEINATGYGLTFGIHSRIPTFYQDVCNQIHAGNHYINRSMIGATVGVQPFGGDGLSGTGPKAGGPFTLLRFASEHTTSNNTAAIGGNIELLMG